MAIYRVDLVGYRPRRFDGEISAVVQRFKMEGARPIPVYFKEWREDKGWTQQELADSLGTSKQTVSRIETGARDWSKGYLEAFSVAIGCAPVVPLLLPPSEHFEANALLNALEQIGKLRGGQPEKVAQMLESLARAYTPAPGPAATAEPPKKAKAI